MKASVITLGCKVNAYESEFIKEQFIKNGYEIVSENADVVVINTCTVTNQSDAKSRKIIRQARRENENAILAVCGCAAEHHKENLIDLDIDILIGNHNKSIIVDLIEEYKNTKERKSLFYDMQIVPFENMEISQFLNRTRVFVKIQDGCNNYCSYCIIPYMRGKCRSKDIDVCYEEVKKLVLNGYKEIVLTGIHTGHYGEDKDYDLVDLIRKISTLDNLLRIRISSIEMTELTDKFMEELKNNKKLCSHMHIPIQSGSNKILKSMNRKYTKEEFINRIEKLRESRTDISITTDLIVGFPGETDEDFLETLDTIDKIKFTKIHTFPYSPRSNTIASVLPNQVNERIKKERVKKVLELSQNLENEYYNKFLNKEIEVLIENNNEGLSSNYIKVLLDNTYENGAIKKVKIIKVDTNNVYGQ